MASQLQNRLVGSVILIALAVIILPELLDGKQVQDQEAFETIPLQPQVEVAEIPVKTIAEDKELQHSDSVATDDIQVTADRAPEVAADVSDEPRPPAAPVTGSLKQAGWVIQMGVFRNQESVDQLIETLRQRGYRAYREQVSINGENLTKLMVGPALTQEELEQQLEKLNELVGAEGRILRFTP
ncbi:SPOR domain-containing protein [Pseudidiomarina sp.]|uniref:SPOR domain-containing protein n=1 Tax=Pseudidiomarina sp. TaxID=2081707 RepID=UPI00299ECB0F|nr:SPOR domain-containing protein [Pseudidiomarina sp.]MDX1705864.1 SPOR domain-containing protein [Pseudidiomarina sp.]